MSRNAATFIPMAGPARAVLEILEDLIEFTCTHTDKEHKPGTKDDEEPTCERVTLENLEQAAVRIADMIWYGELGPSP